MRSVDVRDCAMPGKYVLFQAKHFTSLEVRADGTNMWRTTCRRDVGFPDVQLPLLLRAMEAAFQLKELASSPCERGIDALGSTSTTETAPLPRMEASQWLQLCHNRSQDRARKRVLDDPERKRDIPTENDLIHAGFTASQAQHHITSLQSAFVRERFVHQWEASMPPMIRQIFGDISNPPTGIRIPLPPLNSHVPILSSTMPETFKDDIPEFSWLKTVHPHDRDAAIHFEAKGHKYYVKGEEMDCSVTTLISRCSEDRWKGF